MPFNPAKEGIQVGSINPSVRQGQRQLVPSVPLLLACLPLVLLSGLTACGEKSSQEVVVEATPEATPEPPPPPPPEPGKLYYLVLEEVVSPPPGASWSPLHRSFGPAPSEPPTADFLRDDESGEEVAATLADWSAGRFSSGAELLLVQWTISWGESGEAGTSREWGVCSLPCTLEDSFLARKQRHPADPIEDGLALFSARPGSTSVQVTVRDGSLVVRNGQAVLLAADGELRPAEVKGKWKVRFSAPDGTLTAAQPFRIARRLSVAAHSVHELAIEEVADPVPATARLYPDVATSTSPVPPLVRGIEGLAQYWPWPEAGRFEGKFGLRPDPGQEGLSVERVKQRVRWIPIARQAGEGKADFIMYSVSGGAESAVLKPFPRGVLAVAATVAEGPEYGARFRIAGAGSDAAVARALEVLGAFKRYQAILPLPEGLPDETLVYLSPHPLGVIAGGAGGAAFSLVVDERRSEEASVARAWAHLLLGSNVLSRSAQVADWVRWVEARLLGTEDRSTWTSAFAAAGDDVLAVWTQWMRDPKDAGAPDPSGFLRWVSGKIPVLGRELHRTLPLRNWLVGHGRSSLPSPVAAESSVSLVGATAPYGAAITLSLPAAARSEAAKLQLRVTAGDGASVRWSAQCLEGGRWSRARGDLQERGRIAEGWAAFQTASGDPVPLTVPEAGLNEDSVVAVFLRGDAAWKAQLRLVVELPEGAAANKAAGQTPSPTGAEPAP